MVEQVFRSEPFLIAFALELRHASVLNSIKMPQKLRPTDRNTKWADGQKSINIITIPCGYCMPSHKHNIPFHHARYDIRCKKMPDNLLEVDIYFLLDFIMMNLLNS